MPAEAIVILPGLLLVSATSSATDFTGTDGLTTSTPDDRAIVPTGAKSRMKSYFRSV